MENTDDAHDTVSRTLKKVRARLIPLMMAMYVISYIDRVNVGFAGLQMRDALSLSATVFGFGAGIFYLGYTLFEVPSNLILHRVGARAWMARIMFTWGVISASMAFARGETSFYILRFVQGAAEAGFFPGMMVYMTYWFPQAERARIVGNFLISVPISVVIAAPISGLLLEMDGLLGLGGWQWMFLLEGAPAMVLAAVVLKFLTDRPEKADWLTPEERQTLAQIIAGENKARVAKRHFTVFQALAHPRTILFGILYFGFLMTSNGVVIWLPQVVKSFTFLKSNLSVGGVVAVPYIITVFSVVAWSRHSDKTGERVWHVAIPAFISAIGLILSALSSSAVVQMLGVTMGVAGVYAAMPPFWTLPTSFLSGAAAAGGLALITTIANFGGFVGPFLIGYVRDLTGSYSIGIASMGFGGLIAGTLALTQLRIAARERVGQPR